MQTLLATQAYIIERFTARWVLSKERALQIALCITLIAMVAEFVASSFTGSLMLFSDAIHMLSHAFSLFVSWLAIYLAARYSSKRFPFGLKRLEVLAAFVNGLSLLAFVCYIIYTAYFRILNPIGIETAQTLSVAIFGLAVNLLTAVILSLAGLEDLNTRSAFLHMLADTFSSIAIIIGAIIIKFTNWYVLDGILSLLVALVIAKWSFSLIKQSALVLLTHTPNEVDVDKITKDLYNRFDTIIHVDDVKVWEIANGDCAASIKLRVYPGEAYEYRRLKKDIFLRLTKKYQIENLIVELDW